MCCGSRACVSGFHELILSLNVPSAASSRGETMASFSPTLGFSGASIERSDAPSDRGQVTPR